MSRICTTCGGIDYRRCMCIPRPDGGVGTELRYVIPKVFEKKDCKCQDFAAWMDNIGLDGVLRERQKIIDHLVDSAKKMTFGAAPGKIASAIASKWLDKAIENYRIKLEETDK
jgi:hypothetical protein